MKASHKQVLVPLLSAAVEGVFLAYGEKSNPVTGADQGHDIVAVLGFTSDNVRGGLALGMSAELAQRSAPPGPMQAADWVGEIANQVMGRIRNQLLRYGVDLALGTPVVLAGVGVGIKPSKGTALHHQCFASGKHRFDAFLEVRFREEFEFAAPSAEGVAADEGSVLLFSDSED
jgi:CheY-specific phosphatase CheX